MKNALILHGTNGSAKENWFQWLGNKLKKLEYEVWIPDLPRADKPNILRYNAYISQDIPFILGSESILIGHSSGAVAVLGLLQTLPKECKVDARYLVGVFRGDLGWDALSEIPKTPLNLSLIKTKAKKFVFIHSDDDPYCPLEHAQYYSEQLEGELIVVPGQKHFSTGTAGEKYKQFPLLLSLIKKAQ